MSGYVYAGAADWGGKTWTDCNAGLLDFAKQPHLANHHGRQRASEGMVDSHALAVSPAQPGTVFLANRMGLFRSDDRGDNYSVAQWGINVGRSGCQRLQLF